MWQKLLFTKVKRGGVTSKYYSGVYQNCSFKVIPSDKTLNLSFTMPSKGGGDTEVVVEIPEEDISLIFNEVTQKLQENISVNIKFEWGIADKGTTKISP